MSRFAILQHRGTTSYKPGVHWDLLFDQGETLQAWELPLDPFREYSQSAHSLSPHRRHYLDYEGPLSDDRGTVTRVEAGEFVLIAESDARLEYEIAGQRLRGRIVIEQRAEVVEGWVYRFCPVT